MKTMLTRSLMSTALAGWRHKEFHIGIIAAVAVTWSCVAVSAQQTNPQDLEFFGREIVTQLVARHFSEVEVHFDERMQSALPQEKLAAVWTLLLGQVGAFHRIVRTEAAEQQGSRVAIVNCEFERASLNLTMTVNAQGQVSGLLFVPAGARQAGQPASWSAPSYANQEGFHERDVTVMDGQWKLPGTLTLPNGPGPFAAVVMVHGSGPEDEDETIESNKPFKDLAWGLASQKIAALRYVKRTKQYGAQFSSGPAYTVKDETIDDAEAAVALLASLPEIDHHHVYVLGHSLGGMLAPRIAAEDGEVAGVIIAAGTARPLEEVIVEQLKYIASLHGDATEESKKQIAAAEHAQAEIEDPTLKPGGAVDILGAQIPASYFLDLRAYHPAEAAAKLKVPILVLQGGRDYQVTGRDYDLWKAALGGDPRATFSFYPALTHLFTTGAGSGPASPSDYAVPGHVSGQVIQDIVRWVNRESAAK
jgi:dienelactone hydrolase